MTKEIIVSRIAGNTGFSQHAVSLVISGFLDIIETALCSGDSVTLNNFGVFKPELRAPRLGRNPKTGDEVPIEARVLPVFKPADKLKSAVDRCNRTDI